MNGATDRDNNDSKEFFKADRLRTRTEKDYLMHLAEKPVMLEMEAAGLEPVPSQFHNLGSLEDLGPEQEYYSGAPTSARAITALDRDLEEFN